MCPYQLTSASRALHEQKEQSLDNAIAALKRNSCKTKRSIRFVDEEDAIIETTDSKSLRPLKRARISIDHALEDVPLATQMTEEERSTLWMRKADHRATYTDITEVVRTCQASASQQEDGASSCCHARRRSSSSYVNYAEALATAYNICNEESECSDDASLDKSEKELPLDQLIVYGSMHTQSRGLESKIIPGLGDHRSKKRKEHTYCVLQVQCEMMAMVKHQHLANAEATCCSPDDIAQGLGAVSAYLSKPARRFARALGAVDGSMALLEYATVANSPPEKAKSALMEDMQAKSIVAFLSMQALDSVVS